MTKAKNSPYPDMNNDEYELYKKLAEKFGITMSPPHVYLRYGDKTAHLLISDITDHAKERDRCWTGCGQKGTHDATVTVSQCAGEPYEMKVKLCYDCYCPK